MTEKIAGTVAVLAVVLIGGYFTYKGLTDDEGPASHEPEASRDASSATWAFDPAGTDATEAPLTFVSVTAGGKTYDAGTYQGSCFTIEGSNWELLPGELSGAICWWAGGGTELGLFTEGDELVVKRGYLEEGSAEVQGSRGDFSTLFVLKGGSDSVLLRTKIAQGESGLGVRITPLEVLEDSRCPTDVTCIQAGTVRVRASVESGGSTSESVFILGIVETRENETITLVSVEPAPLSTRSIVSGDYRFTWGIEKRIRE